MKGQLGPGIRCRLEIPLELSTIPTPKEFKDAIELLGRTVSRLSVLQVAVSGAEGFRKSL